MDNVKSRGKSTLESNEEGEEKEFGHWKRDYSE